MCTNISIRQRAMMMATALLGVACSPVAAADFWWGGGASGNWTTQSFFTTQTGTVHTNTLPSTTDTVVFATQNANFLNTTLTAPISVAGVRTDINFFSPAAIGGQALTVGATGVSVAGPVTFGISAPLRTSTGTYLLDVSDAGGLLTLSGGLSSLGTVTKTGLGTVIVSGTSAYSGLTTVNGGLLRMGSVMAVPSGGNVTVLKGVFDVAGTSPTIGNLVMGDGLSTESPTVGNSKVFIPAVMGLAGNISYMGGGSPAIISVQMNLTAGQHLLDNPNNEFSTSHYDVVIQYPIGGPGGLTKTGTVSTVALGASNSYSGPTIINGGAMYVGAVGALPVTTDLTINDAYLFLAPGATENGIVQGLYNQTVRSLSGNVGAHIGLGSATLTVSGPATSTYAGTISGKSGSVVKGGTGTLILTGVADHTWGTTISGGTLQVGNGGTTGLVTGDIENNAALVFNHAAGNTLGAMGTVTGTGTVSVVSGNTAVGRMLAGPVSVSAGASLILAAGGGVSSITGLTLPSGASLDLTNQGLVMHGANLAGVRSMAATWLGNQAGAGLKSSLIASGDHTTLAVFSNTTGTANGFFTSLGGVTLSPTDVIVRRTYVGDTNLDGVLNGTDLSNIIEGFSTGKTGWEWGDLDYSGAVTASDVTTFMSALNLNLPSLGNFSGDGAGGGTVPEPASCWLMAAGGLAIAARRRR